jgi:hypothetical protein
VRKPVNVIGVNVGETVLFLFARWWRPVVRSGGPLVKRVDA